VHSHVREPDRTARTSGMNPAGGMDIALRQGRGSSAESVAFVGEHEV
jgi:hypothetical protein